MVFQISDVENRSTTHRAKIEFIITNAANIDRILTDMIYALKLLGMSRGLLEVRGTKKAETDGLE